MARLPSVAPGAEEGLAAWPRRATGLINVIATRASRCLCMISSKTACLAKALAGAEPASPKPSAKAGPASPKPWRRRGQYRTWRKTHKLRGHGLDGLLGLLACWPASLLA